MRRLLFTLGTSALVAACGFALDGYSGGPSAIANDGGGVEASLDGTAPSEGGVAPIDPPMLVTATASSGTHIRRWDAAAGAWGTPTDGPVAPNGAPIRGITVRRSSVNGHRTMLMYTIDDKLKGKLFAFDWNGTAFTPLFDSDDFGPAAGWAPFDLAFDSASGHGVMVYGGAATGNIRLRTFDGTKWSDEKSAFPKAPNNEPYQFVRLVTRAGADDIAMIWSDQGSNIAAVRWQGDHFGTITALSDQTQNDVQQTFDGAFETKTGDLVFAWASNNTTLYSVSKAGSGEIPAQTGDLMFAQTGRVVLAANPASDQIALITLEQGCMMTNCDDFTGIVWNGTGWDLQADGTLDGDITTNYDVLEADAPATVTWSGERAVAFYHRDSSGFRWGLWSAGEWGLQPDYAPARAIGQKASFVPFHVDGKLYVLVEDRKGTLWNVGYDGLKWNDDDGNQPVADDLPSPTDENGITFSTDTP